MDYSFQELEMGRRFYGFGRWEAPYWFIGPEQGKGPKEADENSSRLQAWTDLGNPELCDCREFHRRIGEQSWHNERPSLQRTWRPLIVLLMTFLGKQSDKASLRAYQRDRWGKVDPIETCVIELLGLPARNLKVPIDRESFRQERMEFIRHKLQRHKPEIVIMYGANDRERWAQIAGCTILPDQIKKRGSTLYAFALHPVSYGRRDSDWVRLGEKLRGEAGHSGV